ncbi:hypothetical protein KJ853_02625 [Patescibacteria group bacterium]|nr:hypothetical protein [Patescibacteria group bacterium]
MDGKQREVLARFLVEAKKKTYASGAKGAKLLMDGEEFRFEGAEFTYWDTHRGFNPFIGNEIVESHNVSITWGMNYYGRLEVADKGWAANNVEKVYKFLKSVLLLVSAKFPFRGPTRYTDSSGEWVYENELEPGSNIEHFCGEERIYFKGVLVYKCEFHGGCVKGK